MYLVYLAGAPATGKSTLMAALTQGLVRKSHEDPDRVPYERLYRDSGELVGAEIGRRREGFPGTDALQMNVMPRARNWVKGHFYDLLLGEGDRLSSMRFLDAAAEGGYEVNLVYMHARPRVLDARCKARGTDQSEVWRSGRATMCMRLADNADRAGYKVHRLNAELTTGELVQELLKLPALKILKGSGS